MNADTTTSIETCPKCGKALQHQTIQFGTITKDFTIECDCDREEREREEAEELKRGTENYRLAMKYGTGLYKRQMSMTFEAFKPKSGQAEAYEICRAYAAAWTKDVDRGLILNGPVGSGKTHLAAAICNDIISRIPVDVHRARRYSSPGIIDGVYSGISFMSAIELLGEIRSAYGSNTDAEEVLRKIKKVKLLVIDDIGTEKMTEWAAEKFFEIIDYRYNEFLPLIITTNLTTGEMKTVLGDRISDRLRSMSKLVNITASSQRTTAK